MTIEPVNTAAAASVTNTKSNSLASADTFLQLLVAQLKNQDPSSPADGTQFVTQLAQFSQLEQLVAIRTDLDTVVQQATDASSTSTTPTTSGGN